MTKTQSSHVRLSCLAFAAFSIIALTAPCGSEGQESPVSSTSQSANSGQIRLYVSVTDEHNRVAANFAKDDFTILDGKAIQQINSFEERNEPYSIGFLIDTSGSMLKPDKDLSALLLKDNILRFMAQSHKANEYFLLTFAGRPQLLMEWTRDIGTAADALNKLALEAPKGPTAFFDACYLGIEKLRRRSHPRAALIMLTDAQDNESKHTYGELRELLKQSDVVIYALYKADPTTEPLVGGGRKSLRELTAISGGVAFAPNNKAAMDKIFDLIALEMQHQYVIGFNPASLDGKWHSIRIKVKPIDIPDSSRPDKPPKQIRISARTREVFYGPTPSR